MTEDENNLLLGLLGTGVAIVLAWFGMQKPAQASTGSFGAPAPPKARTGCGCNK